MANYSFKKAEITDFGFVLKIRTVSGNWFEHFYF